MSIPAADALMSIFGLVRVEGEIDKITIGRCKVMTPEEFRDKMKSLESHDFEDAHGSMDDLMCELLKQLGYHEGVEIFEEQGKWYA